MRLLFLEKKKSKRKTAFLCTHVRLSITGREGGREGGFGLLYFSTRVRAQGGSGGGVPAAHQRGADRPPGEQSPSSLDAPARVPQSRPQPRCPSEVPTRSPGERGSPLVHSFLPSRSREQSKKSSSPHPHQPQL